MSVVHRALYRVSGGLLGANVGAPVLLLTTLGRKSKQSRTTPLLYLEEGDHWIVVASNAGDDRHPAWWLNLKANPIAQIQVKSVVNRVRAEEKTREYLKKVGFKSIEIHELSHDIQNFWYVVRK